MSENIKVGTVLAKEGEWQRKYQITHINTVATTQQWDRVAISFSVCLKYLGEFWADGRSKPSLKQPEKEVLSRVWRYPDIEDSKLERVPGMLVDNQWDGSRLIAE
jgi:hypothetical protein